VRALRHNKSQHDLLPRVLYVEQTDAESLFGHPNNLIQKNWHILWNDVGAIENMHDAVVVGDV